MRRLRNVSGDKGVAEAQEGAVRGCRRGWRTRGGRLQGAGGRKAQGDAAGDGGGFAVRGRCGGGGE